MRKIISLVLLICIILSMSLSIVAADEGANLTNNIQDESELINYVIKKFKDIKENDWYISYAINLISRNVISGKPQKDGTVIFDPMGLVTKSEFTKMLVEAMNYNLVDGNSFKDIGYDMHWSKKYIETAVAEGIIDPEEGEYYWPNLPIKREDMAMMMFKALKLVPSDNPSPFPDINSGYITKLYEEYLISGSPGGNKVYFKPSGLSTRAEAAAIISRLIEYKEDQESFKKLQKVRNEISSIPVTKAVKIEEGKRITNEKEFYKYQSEVLKRPYGYSFEGTDLVIIKGDDNFKDIAIVYNKWDNPSIINDAFHLEILNHHYLDGYKVKFICENRPEIMLTKVRGVLKERNEWMDVKTQSGMKWVYKADYNGEILYALKDGELLNFKIFIDSGKETRSFSLTVKVGSDSLYRE